ncbi:MAG: ribonuclease HII [Micromonosporaceae bacterium]
MLAPGRTLLRRDGGLYALERALRRRGFGRVAGADEAGRGACAGPLVAAAVVLPDGRRGEIPELADSKLLTPVARERVYAEIQRRAVEQVVVVLPSAEVDARGLHVCNIVALRRALAGLTPRPDYVLTDGFPVDGLGSPGLAVWKGDQVAACVAAASVVAKVTRDRIMCEMHQKWPAYGFDEHKGYVTPGHAKALLRHGPCPQHRHSYANVAAALAVSTGVAVGPGEEIQQLVRHNGGMEGGAMGEPVGRGASVVGLPEQRDRAGQCETDGPRDEAEA